MPLFPLTPPTTPSTLTETQKLLLDRSGSSGGNQRIVEGITSSTPKAKQIAFSKTLTKIFPKTHRELINRTSSLYLKPLMKMRKILT